MTALNDFSVKDLSRFNTRISFTGLGNISNLPSGFSEIREGKFVEVPQFTLGKEIEGQLIF